MSLPWNNQLRCKAALALTCGTTDPAGTWQVMGAGPACCDDELQEVLCREEELVGTVMRLYAGVDFERPRRMKPGGCATVWGDV